jgi:hypothetical protein
MSTKYNTFLALLVITILFGSTYTYIFDKKLDLNGDNANYYMLGKALASGEGYVNINSIQKTPNNHFPPGYPAIISGVITLFSDSIVGIKLANGLLFLLTLFGLYFLTLKITGKISTAIIVPLLILFNAHFLRYSTIIMSEVPFTFFSIIVILSFLKINFHTAYWKDPWLYITLLFLIISFYIRTSGIAIISGILLYLVISKRWQHTLILFLGIILLILPWQIRSHKLGGNSYSKQLMQVNPYRPEIGIADLGDYINRFDNNISRYISKEIPTSIFPFYTVDYRQPASTLQWVFSFLLLGLIIYGLWKLTKYKLLILAYLTATFGILFLWPDIWIGIRFMLPIVPFLVIGLVNGIQLLVLHFCSFKIQKMLIWIPAVLIIPLLTTIKPLNYTAKDKPNPNWANYIKLAKWAKQNIDPEAVITCRKPTIFYLYSNTFTVNYKYTEDQKDLMIGLVAKKVDYVVIEQLGYSSTYRYLVPVINNNMQRFQIVHKIDNPETLLLKLQ